MSGQVAQALKQRKPVRLEDEVILGIRIAAGRILEPWGQFLKAHANLSTSQYNVLRILRGSHPGRLPASDIGSRMVARDPDVTRLVDGLVKRGLVTRQRSETDRRVVEIGISAKGLALVASLDPHVARMPVALVGGLGKTKLRQLATLLDELLEQFGTFP